MAPIKLLVLLALLSLLTTRANASFLGITDDAKVKDIISTARAEMAKLVADAGGEARVTMGRAQQLLEALIDTLSAAYSQKLDETFKALDAQQQKAFRDLDQSVENFSNGIVNPTLQKADEITERITTTISTVASWAAKPAVLRYSPSAVIAGSSASPVKLVIKGLNLHKGTWPRSPEIKIGNTKIRADEAIDNRLAFNIPSGLIPARASGIDDMRIELTITVPARFFSDYYHFSLLVQMLPQQIGDVTLQQSVRWDEIESQYKFTCSKDVNGAFREITSDRENPANLKDICPPIVLGGTGSTNTSVAHRQCVSSSDGWTLQPLTAKVILDRKQAWFNCVNAKPDGRYNIGVVTVTADAPGGQACFLATASVGDKAHCAQTTAQFRVREQRKVPHEETISQTKILRWGMREPFVFDSRAAKARTIGLSLFGDQRKFYSADEAHRVGPVVITPDLRQGMLFIAVPKPSDDDFNWK
jgi:hypothetical protein